MKQLVRTARLVLGLIFATTSVDAQTPEERAGARAAAELGVKAFNEGRWADAADLMIRAEKLVHAPTHLLYFAQAEEKLGHLVVAHETYLRIAREPLGRDAPKVFIAAQAEAKERAENLRDRLSQVTIVVQGSPSGTAPKVTVDDQAVPDVLVGVPHPIDPGEHRFEASAAGSRSGITKVVLREGGSETIVLTLQATVDHATPPTAAGSPAPNLPPTTGTPQTPNQAPATSSGESGMHPLKLGGYIGLGIGVVGLGVGTAFAVISHGKRSDADALCNGPNGSCPSTERSKIDQLDADANRDGTIAVVGFVTGGIGAVAGLTMLLLAPSKGRAKAELPTRQHATLFVPYVTSNGIGLSATF